MRVVISGSSGLIGSSLRERLIQGGHETISLIRDRSRVGAGGIFWDPASRSIDLKLLEGFDAVVHLSGRSIGEGPWTETARREMFDSRTGSTQFLAESLAALSSPPRLFLCASAIGYYGDRGDELLDEWSAPGTGFLSDLCVAWEKACQAASVRGIRTVNLRTGIVLAREGGALPQMILPFRFGLGGRLGHGHQFMSWVTLDDLISIIEFVLTHDSLNGPVNAVSPNPVTNRVFTQSLARVLHRPAIIPAPALALRMILGEKAEALLLSSARVIPAKLQQAGFKFRDIDLTDALRHILSK